jgi:hypothetical protein
MCDGLQHARQCGIMRPHNAWHAGLSPLTHASMCCCATGVDPKTVRRDHPPTARQCIENARKGDNPEVREEMKAIAAVRRRFGYRRIGVLLERKGMIMNHKKLYRLYLTGRSPVRTSNTCNESSLRNTKASPIREGSESIDELVLVAGGRNRRSLPLLRCMI